MMTAHVRTLQDGQIRAENVKIYIGVSDSLQSIEYLWFHTGSVGILPYLFI